MIRFATAVLALVVIAVPAAAQTAKPSMANTRCLET